MENPPDVLREYRVKIIRALYSEPLPAYPDDMGLRTKFGGAPDAIQKGEDASRRCPECGQEMRFVAQIDSFEFNGENNPNRKNYGEEQYMFGDVGMIYVWFCFNCLIPDASVECY